MPNVFSMKFEEVDDRACQSDRFRLLCLEFVTISLRRDFACSLCRGIWFGVGFCSSSLPRKGVPHENQNICLLSSGKIYMMTDSDSAVVPKITPQATDLQEVELFVLLFFFVLLDVFQSIHNFDSGVWIAVDFFVSLFQKGALDNTILQRLAVLFGFWRPHWHHCSFCCTVKAVWTSDLRTFSKSCAGEIELLWSVVFEIACSFVLKSKQNWVYLIVRNLR